jgi:hypothetical protein
VTASNNKLEIEKYFLSYLINTHQFSNTEISDITTCMSSFKDSKSLTYCLNILTTCGKHIELDGRFESKKEAEYIKQKMQDAII